MTDKPPSRGRWASSGQTRERCCIWVAAGHGLRTLLLDPTGVPSPGLSFFVATRTPETVGMDTGSTVGLVSWGTLGCLARLRALMLEVGLFTLTRER